MVEKYICKNDIIIPRIWHNLSVKIKRKIFSSSYLISVTGLCDPIVCSYLGGGFIANNRGYMGTTIYPYMELRCFLVFHIYFPDTPSIYPSSSSAPPSADTPTVASATARAPYRYNPYYYHQILETCTPGLRTASTQRSRIFCIEIYCSTVLWIFRMYSSTPYRPASCINSSNEGYSQIPSWSRHNFFPVIRTSTLYWNPSIPWPVQGVRTHVSDQNNEPSKPQP